MKAGGGDSEELDIELLIAKNARVMLTSNLWTEAGLVNGALRYVRNIVYKPGKSPPNPPIYFMVEFDHLTRFPFEDKLVPIIPIDRGQTRQIPLRLAWGLKIHKSQGLTLNKATIDIRERERQGITFVAISCIKALDGIRILSPFPYQCYGKLKSGKGVQQRKAEEERLKSLE